MTRRMVLESMVRADGLPFGITLAGVAHSDPVLLAIASRFHVQADLPLGANLAASSSAGRILAPPLKATIPVAVCGAHLSGLPLNHQLTDRSAELVSRTQTAPVYRLYALPDGPPHRPGMVRVETGASPLK